MPRSSVADPLPVVTPLESLQPDSNIESLRRCYLEACLVPTTHKTIHDFSHTLIAGIFRFVGSDIQEYRQCLNACVHVCKTTGVFRATTWDSWDGFAIFLTRMEKVERLTRHTNLLHCLSAPMLVVAIAVQQVILHDKIGEHDKVSRFFRDFDCYKKAATAIYFYEMNYRQEILTLDQVWDATPFAIQRKPNQSIDQIKAKLLSQRTSTPRNQVPTEIIALDDEQIPVKRESPVSHQAPEFREQRYAEEMPAPMQVQVSAPIPMTMPMPAQMAMSAPVPIPAPTSIPKLMPSMVRETLKEVFRGDVMMQLQPLLDRLKKENWNGVIQRDIMQVLNDRNVRVLPTLAKNMLHIWATRSQNAMLLSWLEQARDDVDSAHALFHDLDAMITQVPQSTIRGPLQAKMNMLRGIFDHQEKSHRDEMLFRVDSLQMDIAKIHDQMAESKQAEGQIAKESAVTRDDAAETDETFAVHIVERGDDTDEDLEERKKKKRKGEKKEPKAEEKEKKKVEKNGGKGKKNGKKEMTMERKIKNREKRKKRSRQEMMEED
ncbi:hypothetical protein TrVGV298_007379 [Trichoderma virens]|nr:hypothetical protein TrVGV298_007379 [Trichoderma virens]